MGEVVNLRRYRKARDKQAREAKAQERRAAFGREKAERTLSDAQTRLEAAKLDAHKRDDAQ